MNMYISIVSAAARQKYRVHKTVVGVCIWDWILCYLKKAHAVDMSVKISYLRLCVKGAAVSASLSVYFNNLVQAVFKHQGSSYDTIPLHIQNHQLFMK